MWTVRGLHFFPGRSNTDYYAPLQGPAHCSTLEVGVWTARMVWDRTGSAGCRGKWALMAAHRHEAHASHCPECTAMTDGFKPCFNLKSVASIDTCQGEASCNGSSHAAILECSKVETADIGRILAAQGTNGRERAWGWWSLIQLFYFWQLCEKMWDAELSIITKMD